MLEIWKDWKNKDYEDYEGLLSLKAKRYLSGFGMPANKIDLTENPLFDYQNYSVRWALEKGRAVIGADTGLGKTLMEFEWARQVIKYTKRPVLLLTYKPIAVQMKQMSLEFGYDVELLNNLSDLDQPKIFITNYEQLKNLVKKQYISKFSGVVLDEASVLKSYKGQTKVLLCNAFRMTKYKLCATATPIPNDYIEISGFSDFLGIMDGQDMVATYFTTDKTIKKGGQKYYLKAHAKENFFQWIKSFILMYRKPSDIGFSDSQYKLPKLNIKYHNIETNVSNPEQLFNTAQVHAFDSAKEMARTLEMRCEFFIDKLKKETNQVLIWVELNIESEYFVKRLQEENITFAEISGKDSSDKKTNKILDFIEGNVQILVTKPSMFKFGMNLQNCFTQYWVSPDFSFEAFYQGVRRSYRFRQENDVNIHVLQLDTTENMEKAIKRKQEQHDILYNELMNVKPLVITHNYEPVQEVKNAHYTVQQGDAILLGRNMADESVHHIQFSPPFSSMYVFSDEPNDFSNVSNDYEWYEMMHFMAAHCYRVLKEGRTLSMHLMQFTTMIGKEGFRSIKDYRGEMIRIFQANGFYFHGENNIWKDVEEAAKRTKHQQLLYGHVKKDFLKSRHGLVDYCLTFRKGANSEEIVKRKELTFDLWCKMANPYWYGLESNDTLTNKNTKGERDEKHITPTQRTPLRWLQMMYTNVGDVVYDPFGGVMTSGVEAMFLGNKYISQELKPTYFEKGVYNLNTALEQKGQLKLF